MSTFTAQAIASIEMVDTYFQAFGMCVLDIQILDFHCHEKSIEKMLEQDIHITVIKQNELRAVQSDVLIQEQVCICICLITYIHTMVGVYVHWSRSQI